jgi:UDP-N-acetylmuramoyl-L-alanyl-D-glutamate--2,6-diaminopimelate ligase
VSGGPLLSAETLLAMVGAPAHRLTSDSRRVRRGDTFAAYRGEKLDGRDYIAQAIAAGAGSVLWECGDARAFRWRDEWRVPHLPVYELKRRLGELADIAFGRPSQGMWVIAVTGTNGKTSCSQWIAQALEAQGRRCAVFGTLGNGFPNALVPGQNTTSDAAALQEALAQLRKEGAVAAAMEASSHGLAQYRLNGMKFDVALFTNLTRDHLDYHGTFEAYGEAKARLFDWPSLRHAVVNADDAFGRRLVAQCQERGLNTLGYGFASGELRGRNLRLSQRGLAFEIETPWGHGEVQSELVGAFNASNLLGVVGVLLASALPLEQALAEAARFQPVAGRMQRAGGAGKPLIVVDYAHTPDALEKALLALRPFTHEGARLVCVFGCGGERDAGKRPEMGAIAARLADAVYVTSDNPRSEDPQEILRDILAGIPKDALPRVEVEVERALAIYQAIASADASDVILLAGKGHEPYQEIAGVRHPFNDLQQAQEALAQWTTR